LKCGLNFVTANVLTGKRMDAAPSVPYSGDNQPASLTISNMPCFGGINIEQAYVWMGSSGDGSVFNFTLTDPQNNTTTFSSGSPIGSGPDKCWGKPGAYTYRVDVTSSITSNGTYSINGLPTDPPNSNNDIDGATLMIIYSDSSKTYEGTLSIHDGAIVVNGGSASETVTNFTACENSSFAQAFMIIADLQGLGSTMSMNGGPSLSITEDFWDFEIRNTNVSSGQTTSSFGISSSTDCYNWLVAGLYYQTNCLGCTSTNSSVIVNAQTPVCEGDTSFFNVSVTTGIPPYTYFWFGDDGFTSTSQNATHLYSSGRQ